MLTRDRLSRHWNDDQIRHWCVFRIFCQHHKSTTDASSIDLFIFVSRFSTGGYVSSYNHSSGMLKTFLFSYKRSHIYACLYQFTTLENHPLIHPVKSKWDLYFGCPCPMKTRQQGQGSLLVSCNWLISLTRLGTQCRDLSHKLDKRKSARRNVTPGDKSCW